MNKQDKENIKQAVAEIIFGLTDNESLEKLKEYCTQAIKEGLEESRNQGIKEIEHAKEICREWANESHIINSKMERMYRTVSNGEQICERIEQAVSKYETTKRAAEGIANNASFNGFECSNCGCILKIMNLGGKWTNEIKYCPNCGGENIQYKQLVDKDGFTPIHGSPFQPRKAGRKL